MTLERALEVLGVSGIPSEEQVRRAYLRRLRANSPERDPEGFKRLREAYDFFVARFAALSAPDGGSFAENSEPTLTDPAVPQPSRADTGSRAVGEPPSPRVLIKPETATPEQQERAAEQMIAWLDGPEGCPLPAPLWAIELGLDLLDAGQAQLGERLIKAVNVWLTKADYQRLPALELPAVAALGREIARASHSLPGTVVHALTQAARQGAIELAIPELERFRSTDPYAASEAAAVLEAASQALAQALDGALGPPNLERPRPVRVVKAFFGWAAASLIGFGFMAALGELSKREAESHRFPADTWIGSRVRPTPTEVVEPQPRNPWLAKPRGNTSVEKLSSRLEDLCAGAREMLSSKEIDFVARELAGVAAAGTRDEVLRSFCRLDEVVTRSNPRLKPMRDDVEALVSRYWNSGSPLVDPDLRRLRVELYHLENSVSVDHQGELALAIWSIRRASIPLDCAALRERFGRARDLAKRAGQAVSNKPDASTGAVSRASSGLNAADALADAICVSRARPRQTRDYAPCPCDLYGAIGMDPILRDVAERSENLARTGAGTGYLSPLAEELGNLGRLARGDECVAILSSMGKIRSLVRDNPRVPNGDRETIGAMYGHLIIRCNPRWRAIAKTRPRQTVAKGKQEGRGTP